MDGFEPPANHALTQTADRLVVDINHRMLFKLLGVDMPFLRNIKTLAVLLALESVYVLAATIVVGRFGASMAALDDSRGRGQSGLGVLLGFVAVAVLGFAAVHLWRAGLDKASAGGVSKALIGSALLVNLGMLVLGFMSRFWLLVVFVLLIALMLGTHLLPRHGTPLADRLVSSSAP